MIFNEIVIYITYYNDLTMERTIKREELCSSLFKINQYLWDISIFKMIKEENNNSFDWVYYVIGFVFAFLTGLVISGSFGWAILVGILGFIGSTIFVGSIVKNRVH